MSVKVGDRITITGTVMDVPATSGNISIRIDGDSNGEYAALHTQRLDALGIVITTPPRPVQAGDVYAQAGNSAYKIIAVVGDQCWYRVYVAGAKTGGAICDCSVFLSNDYKLQQPEGQ